MAKFDHEVGIHLDLHHHRALDVMDARNARTNR